MFCFSSFSLFHGFFHFFLSFFKFIFFILLFLLFSGAQKFFFGLNCFTISYNNSWEKHFLSSLGKSTPLRPLFLFSFFHVFHFFFFRVPYSLFFLKIVFLLFFFLLFFFLNICASSICIVSGFNKRCFLRGPCSMEMWCPDDMERDSWDWVGPPTWERA